MRVWVGWAVALSLLLPFAAADEPIPELPPLPTEPLPPLPTLPGPDDPPTVIDPTCVTLTAIPTPAEDTYVTPVASETEFGFLVAVDADGSAGGLFVVLVRPYNCVVGEPDGLPVPGETPPTTVPDVPALPTLPNPSLTAAAESPAAERDALLP